MEDLAEEPELWLHRKSDRQQKHTIPNLRHLEPKLPKLVRPYYKKLFVSVSFSSQIQLYISAKLPVL
jgi:hypothetical protein